jgi:hypothetical protein
MKLGQQDRESLYEARKKKKPAELLWPPDGPILERGAKYPVYSEESGERLFTIRVEDFKREGDRKRATVVFDSHATRVLPGLKGIRAEDGSYETEPERVPAAYEGLLAIEGLQKTKALHGERKLEAKQRGKEQRAGTESRSERAVTRHHKATERQVAA